MRLRIQLLTMMVALASAGCSDPKADPSGQSRPSAGGMNEDIGSFQPCTSEARFDLDAQTPLGYSARDLLPYIEGRYRFPLTWSDPCSSEGNACVRPRSCDSAGPRAELSVAGTDTFLTLDVRATGESALAKFAGDGEAKCGASLRIPVQVRMESEDGAFSLQFTGEAWDESGRHAQVQADDLFSEATGSLLSQLPAGTRLDLGFGGGEQDYWYFDMYFINGDRTPALLKGALAGSCVGEGSRSAFVVP